MRRTAIAVLIAAASAALAACGDPPKNPATLYLTLNGSERVVKLTAQEPGPY